MAKITCLNLEICQKWPKSLILTPKMSSTSFHQQFWRSNFRERVRKSLSYDATVGLFGANAIFSTIGPVLGSKMAIFGPKTAFFMILNFYLMPACASLCNVRSRKYYSEIFDDEVREVIFKNNQLDVFLYSWCYNKLVKTLEVAKGGEEWLFEINRKIVDYWTHRCEKERITTTTFNFLYTSFSKKLFFFILYIFRLL